MALYKYFKQQSLPTSEETNVGKVMTQKANAVVQAVLNEEQSGKVKGGKRKYTCCMPEHQVKIAKYATEKTQSCLLSKKVNPQNKLDKRLLFARLYSRFV